MDNQEQRIRDLENLTRLIPSRFAGGGSSPAPVAPVIWLQVIDGNTLAGSITNGVKKTTTQLAVQVVWRDPYAATIFPDGLGRAYIWRNGVQGVVRDAAAWNVNTAYNIGDKIRGTTVTEAYICTVAGTSALVGPGPTGGGLGIVDGTCTWDNDPTVGWKGEQVLALLDNRAQWPYAIGETEWTRVFQPIVIGNATNPATGLAEDMRAYPLAYL
jgi:hypothetical protein